MFSGHLGLRRFINPEINLQPYEQTYINSCTVVNAHRREAREPGEGEEEEEGGGRRTGGGEEEKRGEEGIEEERRRKKGDNRVRKKRKKEVITKKG